MEKILLSIETDIWVAMSLMFVVIAYGWAKNQLGSAKLAILFAILVVYLTIYNHPELVWVVVALFLFATFGKELLAKVKIYEKEDPMK